MADLHELVRRLGGDLSSGGRAAVIPGPGHSPRDRSLSLRLGDDDRVVFYSHAGDSCREVMNYLGIDARHSDSESSRHERERLRRIREAENRAIDAKTAAFCRDVLLGTVALPGTPADTYLGSRGLFGLAAEDLRFHPAAPRSREGTGTAPALVGVARNVSGEPKGLHVTFIKPDGSGKAGDRSRIMYGPVAGCAVRLGNITRAGVLSVGEGLETSASYPMLHEPAPAWAALSTAGMKAFDFPLSVRRLIIAADGDDAGMAAADELAHRAKRRCEVVIHQAPAGRDWNDILGDRP